MLRDLDPPRRHEIAALELLIRAYEENILLERTPAT